MQITKELIKQYRKGLEKQYRTDLKKQYSKKSISIALDIISCSDETWGEISYPTSVEPAVWVVAAVCEALENGKVWAGWV